MLARIDDLRGAFAGVHATYLAVGAGGAVTQDPTLKAQGLAKMTRGAPRGGAIRLFEADAVLGLSEGIEDALAAQAQAGLPCWACLDAGKLAAVELPFAVSEVVIFADRDRPQPRCPRGVGIAMALRARARFQAEHRTASVLVPKTGKDFAEQLRHDDPA